MLVSAATIEINLAALAPHVAATVAAGVPEPDQLFANALTTTRSTFERNCLAPRALLTQAWGVAPGIRLRSGPSAESASQFNTRFSIPDILLVEINAVLAQQF